MKISRCAGLKVKKSYKKKAYILKFQKISRYAGLKVDKSYKNNTYILKNFQLRGLKSW